jgi:hypothetical protein
VTRGERFRALTESRGSSTHYDKILTTNLAMVFFEPVSSPCIGRNS